MEGGELDTTSTTQHTFGFVLLFFGSVVKTPIRVVSLSRPLTYGVSHVVLALLRVQQLRFVVFGFNGWPSPRT